MPKWRPTQEQRKYTYSSAQQKKRLELLPWAHGTQCPMCGQIMYQEQRLQLDHTLPVALGGTGPGDRIVHGWCNESAGSRLGNWMRGTVRASRDW